MADLDFFKRVNDTYGHQVGDQVLVEMARRMSAAMRTYDAIGRYGGEEFLVILPGCALAEVAGQAERMRQAVSESPIQVGDAFISISISVGITSSCNLNRPEQRSMIDAADAGLYIAKQNGRNRVEAGTPTHA
jgi:diguanylate cyclase (GGDEF)-like protein